MTQISTIEKLAQKYFELTGDSPQMSFWCWLDAMGISPDEESLNQLLNDEDVWGEEQ